MHWGAREAEVINLAATVRSINSMLNYRLLSNPVSNDRARPIDSCHSQLLNILLLDFLAEKETAFGKTKISRIKALRMVCENPQFNVDNSIGNLMSDTEKFYNWIENDGYYPKVFFSEIDKEIDMKFPRGDYIKICGNIAKHDELYLSRVSSQIVKILEKHGIVLSDDESFLVLEDFYTWFHDNIFDYHIISIVYMLNNIMNSIHDYLIHEYKSSVQEYYCNEMRLIKWKYRIPNDIKTSYGQYCYWDLMNEIRTKPRIKRFSIDPVWSKRY